MPLMSPTERLCFKSLQAYEVWKHHMKEYIRSNFHQLLLYTRVVQKTVSVACIRCLPMTLHGMLRMIINMRESSHSRDVIVTMFDEYTRDRENRPFLNVLYNDLLLEYDTRIFRKLHDLPLDVQNIVLEYLTS